MITAEIIIRATLAAACGAALTYCIFKFNGIFIKHNIRRDSVIDGANELDQKLTNKEQKLLDLYMLGKVVSIIALLFVLFGFR